MRITELHTLPTHAVELVRDRNLASMKNLTRYSQSWNMADNVVTICQGILNSRKEKVVENA